MPLLLFLLSILVIIPVSSIWASPSDNSGSSSSTSFFSFQNEQRINRLIANMVKGHEIQSKPYLQGRKIKELTLEKACQQAREKNLDLRLTNLDYKIVREDIPIKDSVFDPVFDLKLSYTITNTYERFEEIRRLREKETDWEEFTERFRKLAELEDLSEASGEDSDCVGCTPCIYIDGILMNPDECESNNEYSVRKEYASISMQDGAIPDILTGSVSTSKKLPWGQKLDLTLQSKNRINRYPSLGEYNTLYTYDEGVTEFPYGNNPWSSSISFNFSTPLPYSKYFGSYGSFANVDSKVAHINTKNQLWQQRVVEKTVIEEIQKTYWDLVWAVKRLQIINEACETLETMAFRINRLFKQGYKTSYDKAQAEASLGNMENQEEIAWNYLMVKSNRLVELLGLQNNTLVLPVQYTRELDTSPDLDPASAISDAFYRRPELKVAQAEYESNEILYRYRKNQVKPDIRFSFSLSLSQTDTYWGYPSFIDSWKNIFHPDNEYYSFGITMNFPFGNRAAKSALKRSKKAKKRSKDRINIKKISITKEVNRAISAVEINNHRVGFAKNNLDKMSSVYKKAQELREGDQQISDFELLHKYNEVINARLTLLNALIEHKKSQIELLFAKGEYSGIENDTAYSNLNNLNSDIKGPEKIYE